MLCLGSKLGAGRVKLHLRYRLLMLCLVSKLGAGRVNNRFCELAVQAIVELVEASPEKRSIPKVVLLATEALKIHAEVSPAFKNKKRED